MWTPPALIKVRAGTADSVSAADATAAVTADVGGADANTAAVIAVNAGRSAAIAH